MNNSYQIPNENKKVIDAAARALADILMQIISEDQNIDISQKNEGVSEFGISN